jgi:hypothetical protein
MSHYKIKLEDKAAFLNRLEKQDIHIGSYDITDNKYEGYFEVDIEEEYANEIIKSILNKSPKINTIKEMRQQITKTQLKQIIREELDKMKKQQVDENVVADALSWVSANSQVLGTVASLFGIVGTATAAAVIAKLKQFKEQGVTGSKMELVKKALQAAAGEGVSAIEKSTGANSTGQGIGGNK